MQKKCVFYVSRDFAHGLLQDFVNFLQRMAKGSPASKEAGQINHDSDLIMSPSVQWTV